MKRPVNNELHVVPSVKMGIIIIKFNAEHTTGQRKRAKPQISQEP
jgi:hypothetical protein